MTVASSILRPLNSQLMCFKVPEKSSQTDLCGHRDPSLEMIDDITLKPLPQSHRIIIWNPLVITRRIPLDMLNGGLAGIIRQRHSDTKPRCIIHSPRDTRRREPEHDSEWPQNITRPTSGPKNEPVSLCVETRIFSIFIYCSKTLMLFWGNSPPHWKPFHRRTKGRREVRLWHLLMFWRH